MATANHVEQARRDGVVLGVPLGDLGWFQSLLMGTAMGMTAFFVATFLGIVSLMIDMMISHHTPDFAKAYRVIGFPIGVTVLAVSYLYLGYLWVRRMQRRRHRSEA